MKTSILGTGLSGLVGSRVTELLSCKYDFEDLSFETGVDITDKDKVVKKVKQSQTEWIIHMAAKTEVDGCEKDKPLGESGAAWKINVSGTKNIVDAAKEFNKRVLYISTDFVFDGKKEFYTEEDLPKPVNWYAVTKYEGEKLVLQDPQNLLVRITYPYRAKCVGKMDFVHHLLNQLNRKQPLILVTDHIFTPTLIDDIATGIDLLIQNKASGIYHLVGSSWLSPFEAAAVLCHEFNFSQQFLNKTNFQEFYKNRAPRPYHLRTKNDKIKKLGLTPKTFVQGIKEIRRQGIEY